MPHSHGALRVSRPPTAAENGTEERGAGRRPRPLCQSHAALPPRGVTPPVTGVIPATRVRVPGGSFRPGSPRRFPPCVPPPASPRERSRTAAPLFLPLSPPSQPSLSPSFLLLLRPPELTPLRALPEAPSRAPQGRGRSSGRGASRCPCGEERTQSRTEGLREESAERAGAGYGMGPEPRARSCGGDGMSRWGRLCPTLAAGPDRRPRPPPSPKKRRAGTVETIIYLNNLCLL